MALWGNNDNRDSQGTVTLDYATGICTGSNGESPGSGTLFGESGSVQVGDVIRFGTREKDGTRDVYFGEAVVVSIASTTSLTIGSTANLSGVAIAATSFSAASSPKYVVGDSSFSEAQAQGHGYSKLPYGVAAGGVDDAQGGAYATAAGWVGVTTYVDESGSLRVKKEVLVAMSGITTGNTPSYPNIEDAV